MGTLAPPITVEDYKVLPETGPRYQLVEGSLEMAPAPNRFHQDISRNIEFAILQWINTGGGGKVYDAPFDVYLDDTNVFQPDIAFISPENLGILTAAGAEGAPDLIVEILSPSNRALDLGPKKKLYARFGVKELWMIDPEPRTISKYSLRDDAQNPIETISESGFLESDLLPGLKIAGAEAFAQ